MEVEYMTIGVSKGKASEVANEFDKKLNEAVSDGWTPHGNPVVTAGTNSNEFGCVQVFMFQVMSRFKTTKVS